MTQNPRPGKDGDTEGSTLDGGQADVAAAEIEDDTEGHALRYADPNFAQRDVADEGQARNVR